MTGFKRNKETGILEAYEDGKYKGNIISMGDVLLPEDKDLPAKLTRDKLNLLQQEYAQNFDDGFPMIPIAWGRSDEEVIKIIEECLVKGKDAYELGYVKDDPDIVY